MQVPKLLKNESAASFRARVKAWEKHTGKKYPTTIKMKGTVEQQILQGNPLDTPYFGSLTIPRDYSKDIINKDGSFTKEYLTEAGKEDLFSRPLPTLTTEERQNQVDEAKWNAYSQALNTKSPKQPVNNKLNKSLARVPNPLTIEQFESGNVEAPQGVPGKAKYGWSDVFTINPETGEALGVMTKNQRRAFEKKYWNNKKIDKSKKRTYNPNKSKGEKAYTRYG